MMSTIARSTRLRGFRVVELADGAEAARTEQGKA